MREGCPPSAGRGVPLPSPSWKGLGAVLCPSSENFLLYNLEMAHFDAHLRYDVLILKFCLAT